MSSSTKYAVLALVTRKPSYGYALMQQLRRWAADPDAIQSSSVYHALSSLERDQLIEPRGPAAHSATDRQPRLTYGATPAGEAALERWLATPPASHDELRLRIGLARPGDLAALIAYVRREQELNLQRLEDVNPPSIAEIEARSGPWEALCASVLPRLENLELAAQVRWLDEVHVVLESLRRHPAGRKAAS